LLFFSELLGARIETETEIGAIAEQLSRINEQLAIKNRRARRIWKTVGVTLIVLFGLFLLSIIVAIMSFYA
jgi:putative transcriptional regulator